MYVCVCVCVCVCGESLNCVLLSSLHFCILYTSFCDPYRIPRSRLYWQAAAESCLSLTDEFILCMIVAMDMIVCIGLQITLMYPILSGNNLCIPYLDKSPSSGVFQKQMLDAVSVKSLKFCIVIIWVKFDQLIIVLLTIFLKSCESLKGSN